MTITYHLSFNVADKHYYCTVVDVVMYTGTIRKYACNGDKIIKTHTDKRRIQNIFYAVIFDLIFRHKQVKK